MRCVCSQMCLLAGRPRQIRNLLRTRRQRLEGNRLSPHASLRRPCVETAARRRTPWPWSWMPAGPLGPCLSGACPVCRRALQRMFVHATRSLFDEHRRDMMAINIVSAKRAIPYGHLDLCDVFEGIERCLLRALSEAGVPAVRGLRHLCQRARSRRARAALDAARLDPPCLARPARSCAGCRYWTPSAPRPRIRVGLRRRRRTAALYFRPGAASRRRTTSSWFSTTGALRGLCTVVRWRTRSGRSNVTLKKNRSAAMPELMVGAPIRRSAICNRKRRRSSLVEVSGDRPRNAAKLRTCRCNPSEPSP